MRRDILGVGVDAITVDQVLDRIGRSLTDHRQLTIVTVNPEFVMAAQAHPEFRRVLNQADLALADGIGLLWAARLLQYRPHFGWLKPIEVPVAAMYFGLTTLFTKQRFAVLPQKITGVDLVQTLAQRASSDHWSVFLLGAQEGIAVEAANHLRRSFSQLEVTGTFAGDGAPSGDHQTQSEVSAHPADILLVAYGAPKQELWIDRNLKQLPVSVAIGVGGTFDFLAGQVRRAPKFIQAVGLEWLFRLILEPWRWRRQLALPRFCLAIIQNRIRQAT